RALRLGIALSNTIDAVNQINASAGALSQFEINFGRFELNGGTNGDLRTLPAAGTISDDPSTQALTNLVPLNVSPTLGQDAIRNLFGRLDDVQAQGGPLHELAGKAKRILNGILNRALGNATEGIQLRVPILQD